MIVALLNTGSKGVEVDVEWKDVFRDEVLVFLA